MCRLESRDRGASAARSSSASSNDLNAPHHAGEDETARLSWLDMARSVLDQILEYGEVRRGLLGVNIFAVTPAVAEAYDLTVSEGALVSEVSPGSAADKAGIVMALTGMRHFNH